VRRAAAALAWLLVAACAAPPRPPMAAPGDTHETPAASATKAAPAAAEPPEDLATARVRLDAALAAGTADALVHANRVVSLGGTLEDAVRTRVADLVDELTGAALEEVWPRLEPRAFPASIVAARRVRLALHQREGARARELLSDILGDDARLASARTEVAAFERRAQVAASVIGVLLPLSGPRAALGKELRAAIELAAADAPGVKLVFVDTGGDEARAARAVDDLVEREHPIALLGPVGERESAAASARALALGVPIALLTPTEGLADARAGVFTLWSSGEDRARLAARAAIDLGYEAPAVLAPRDDAGRAQARAFADEAAALGHPVVAVGEYDPTAADLEPDVKAFLGLEPGKNERLREWLRKHPKDGWKTFSPEVGFDGLFVPDSHDHAALVVAFLVYFNVELRTAESMDSIALARKHGGRPPSFVRLIGSAGWNHPDLGLRGGADVEWALVVDVFFAGEAASEAAADLVERFGARAGRPPSSLAAQAFDAAELLFAARTRAAAAKDPRAALAAALAAGVLDDGACGPARVGRSGELERGGVLLRVEGGELHVSETLELAAGRAR
jgi:branched-chain amino acid transport system substrate-binding protein